jgi:cysteine desulfurase
MNPETTVYLDFNATTPVDQEVLDAMLPYFTKTFANASSALHIPGREAARAVAHARETIAGFIDCEPNEFIFTSGSTESINLAIKGAVNAYSGKGRHIITWNTEHKAVLDVLASLGRKGVEVTILPVNRSGEAELVTFSKSIRPDTILACMMLANNETGFIHPVREFSDIARAHGCLFFCDATQAPGKLRIDVQELGVDLICLSAHKMYGPKGCGGLFVRRKNPRVKLEPLIEGGGHEKGLRSGTLNVPGIVGFAAAAKLCNEKFWDDTSRMSQLRTLLEQQLTDNGLGYVNGSVKNRLPNTSSICFPGTRASSLLASVPGIALSAGSACSSALPEPSHVLLAMGLTKEDALASVRFSLGRSTTIEEINQVVQVMKKAVASERSGYRQHIIH